MSKTAYMRGLQNFIQDIRLAQNKEQEQKRVEKELAKIRERFHDDRSLSGYDRRKYTWKLLYIYMLGYDVGFGQKQAVDLIPRPKYKDKQVGYMACSLLLRENDEILRLTLNAIRNDLISRNEAFETLALSFIGSVGGAEMADALTQDVLKLLSSGTARPLVKKRAALSLLRLIRKTPSEHQVVSADTFSPLINQLLEETDLGLLLSVTTLLHGVCARNGAAGYEGCQPRLIKILERLTMQREREVKPEYLYYGIPSPWLQCKCLRVLQFFPPPEAAADRTVLNTILQGIIDSVGTGDAARSANANKANALYAILFEAIQLALQYDTDRTMLATCVTVLGTFLNSKEPNVKYLALETLSRLALVPDILEAIRHHQATVVDSLKDGDVSIRKRAMDLLFTMCDASCAEELVREMLAYLITADFSIRDELVLKVAILAEKFAPNVQWYVDTTLELLEKAGDHCSEDVWHRVVQLVTNNPAMQQYAARNVVAVLKRSAKHESLICTASYILGEFGRLITSEVPPLDQFKLLNESFNLASPETKGILLTAFIKIYLLEPDNAALRTEVLGLFEKHQKFMDAELQQRATEYLRIAAQPQATAQQYFLPMPKWVERESSLLKRLQETEGKDADTLALPGAANGAVAGNGGTTQPSSPRLVVGGPKEEAAAEPAAPAVPTQPSVDLLGSANPSVEPPAANGGAAQPAAKPAPQNAVDLLSDLLGDAIISPPAAPAVQPGMTPPGAPGPYGGPTGYGPQPTGQQLPPGFPANYTGASMGPQMTVGYSQQMTGMQYPGAPGYQPQMTGMQPLLGYQAQMTSGGTMHQPPGMPPQMTGAGVPPQQTGGMPGMPVQFTGAAPGMYAQQFTGAAPIQPGGPYAGPTGSGPAPGLGASSSFAGPAGAAAAAAAYAAMGVPPQVTGSGPDAAVRPVGNVEQWYNNLMYKDKGILYEDPYLQVGLQARYTRGTGTVVLFLGNKNKTAPLTDVHVIVTPPPGLMVNVTNPPAVLAPGKQEQVPISLMCAGPFVGAPGLTLAYSMASTQPGVPGAVVRQELRLPVTTHKFMVPDQGIAKELFFSQWKANSAPPARAQEMVERSNGPLSSAAVIQALRMVNLGAERGYLDPSPHNEAGAAYFICQQQQGAPETPILVMARVEGNPSNMAQFRVTVSSPAPEVSAHVKELLVSFLKTAAA